MISRLIPAFAICWGLGVSLLPASLNASVAPISDVRILMDVSGSMKKNDPDNLRSSALRLISELLPVGTRAGVWTFGRYVNMQVKLGVVDDRWKQAARAGAAALHSRGLFTNIEEVIDRATRDWRTPDSRYRRSLILLTDGVVDISKNPVENAASRQRILDRQLTRLNTLGVEIYTVALSADSDAGLLAALANKTGGWYEMTESADRLQRVFLRMFEKTVQADTLPLIGNKFTVDPSVDELTLLVFKPEGGESVELLPPGAESTISARAKPGQYNWLEDTSYELITIKKPPQGEWKIVGATDPDNRVMIVTDLRLQVDGLPNQVLPENRLHASVSMQEAGETITRKKFLDLVKIQLTVESELSVDTYSLLDDGLNGDSAAGDGLFFVQLPELGEGQHTLEFNVDGGTFVRAHRHELEVQWPVAVELKINHEDKNGLHLLVIEPREQFVDPEGLLLEVSLKRADNSEVALGARKSDSGAWLVSIDTRDQTAESSLDIKIKGHSAGGKLLDQTLPPILVPGGTIVNLPTVEMPPLPAPLSSPAEQTNWLIIGSILGGVCVLLILLGMVGWKILRDSKNDEPGDSVEDAEGIEAAEEIEEIETIETIGEIEVTGGSALEHDPNAINSADFNEYEENKATRDRENSIEPNDSAIDQPGQLDAEPGSDREPEVREPPRKANG